MSRLAPALLLLLATPLLAAEAHEAAVHHFLGLPVGAWQALNLVVFLVLLVYLLRKPAASFFQGRSAEVAEALKRSEENRRRAEELAREVDAKIARLATDLAAFEENAKTQAAAERDALKRQTEEESARLVSRTEAEIENRVRVARAELTAYAADLAVETAREILKSSVTPEDQARLVEEGVTALKATPARPRG